MALLASAVGNTTVKSPAVDVLSPPKSNTTTEGSPDAVSLKINAPRPAPVAVPVAPTPAPVEYSSLNNPFLDYRDTLSGGANYADINDVDKVDDFYDNVFEKAFTDTGYLTDIDIIGGEGGIGGGQVDYSPCRS